MAMDRRRFLGALALAPAALGACAGGSGAARGGRGAATEGGGAPPREDAGLSAVRGFPLPAGAEPALVFRAAAVRPGES